MIVVVCANPALDLTYGVDEVEPGATHRVQTVSERAGGKGVNVARVLRQLGQDVVLVCLLGGRRGTLLREELAEAGLVTDAVDVAGQTRRTVTVVDCDDATSFTEPGPSISAAEWRSLVERVAVQATGAQAVVLSGSLPPGAPEDGYAELTRTAHEHGAPVVIDADGPALALALTAHPDLVAPNEHEARAIGHGESPVDGLLAAGARGAVVSRGATGLDAAVGGRRFAVDISAPVAGNPTGAGDALTAGLVAGLVVGADWTTTLHDAAAVAAGAVARALAGGFDPVTARRLRPFITVTEI